MVAFSNHSLWREHGIPLTIYFLLTSALTWPTIAFFTDHIPGHSYDAFNGLWVMWHVKEAVLGNQPLFELPLLYYPYGATLLTHVPGPVTGFFALPFWSLGPEAAHNSAVLISFVLTGYFMYLLGRNVLGFTRPIAFFAGLMLLVAPMHLAGLWGHTTKVFFGALPLVLLALHRALDPARSIWWTIGAALALLFTFLHHSLQFIMALIAIAFFILATFLSAPVFRRLLVKRVLLLAASFLLIVGPLLLATAVAAYDPSIAFNHNLGSFSFQPDLLEFFLPSKHSLLLGQITASILEAYGLEQGIETTVSLAWVGLVLCGVALIRGGQQARIWLLFTLTFVTLALGPVIKIGGRLEFTEYELPIILPYAFLTGLPGLDFLRTPGRFMQMGFVGFAVTACYGLNWLIRAYPRQARFTMLLSISLLLLESWPQPWPQMTLRPVPAFYEQIARDDEVYGVLDLPFTPSESIPAIVYNTHYQMYQMTHKKGIAMGYISRTYASHPVLPCLIPEPVPPQPDVLVNGHPTRCYANTLFDLAHFNYRYVVWHKPQPSYSDYLPNSQSERQTMAFIEELFGRQEPIMEDELVQVYAVPSIRESSHLQPTLGLLNNWNPREWDWRWARSPATLFISVPEAQDVILQITPAAIYEPTPTQAAGNHGRLQVKTGNGSTTTIELNSDQMTEVPLNLIAGVHTITLSLEAGNFRPSDYGEEDSRWLSFAIHSINLQISSP